MFNILSAVFYGLFMLGMIIFLVGFCCLFIRIFSPGLNVRPKRIMMAGGLVLASSLIPLVMTLFV